MRNKRERKVALSHYLLWIGITAVEGLAVLLSEGSSTRTWLAFESVIGVQLPPQRSTAPGTNTLTAFLHFSCSFSSVLVANSALDHTWISPHRPCPGRLPGTSVCPTPRPPPPSPLQSHIKSSFAWCGEVGWAARASGGPLHVAAANWQLWLATTATRPCSP